jgi:hypothetical protein
LSCTVVAGADVTSDYLFIAANATATQDDVREYLIRASLGGELVSARASQSSVVAPADARRTAHPAGGPNAGPEAPAQDAAFAIRLERQRRLAERRLLGGRALDVLESASRQQVSPTAHPALARATSPAVAVGDTLSYRVGNAAATNLCSSFTTVRAVVRAAGLHGLIVQDVNAPAGGFTEADFLALAQEFDAITYPTVSSWFGSPTDINGDGRITMLFTPEINRLTPTGSLGFAGGFFFMGDLLARSIPSQSYQCAASNEQEILYLLAPDPTGQVNGNRFSVETARESARGTMAHEVQHMISQGLRQRQPGGALEVDWLNEGLSHFAEEVVGRASRGYGDSQKLEWDDVLVDLDDFDSFFRQNLLRFRFWLDGPDLASPVSARAASELAPRGAAWALVRFAVDQYGGTDPRAFTRALVSGPGIDVANLEARSGAPFDRILPGFLVAAYGEVPTATFGSAYRFASWNLRDVMETLNGGLYPLRLTSFPTETTARAQSGSGRYFFVSRAARADPATFRVLDPGGQPVSAAGARVYLVRLR